MTLATGSRLGPYEVLAPLGAGGMGEVYKAKDTRLDRTVAVKVLPQHLSTSAEVRQRFEREAKAIAALSHPHICALYDVGREGESEYLVMELLEGETLSSRLVKGPLPFEQALRCGIEIADALDRAHRQGIVHRDLKPGNVMLTKSGVKLLDFGLAKALPSPSGKGEGLTSVPTQAGRAPLTQEGTILGTFQYMAPEQLEGREVDGRSDIFAFGAVLYEMATGKKAFSGSSQASLISAIMKDEPPPVSATQPVSPQALDHVVGVCLEKDPNDRWQSAHDVMVELRWIAEQGPAVGSTPAQELSARQATARFVIAPDSPEFRETEGDVPSYPALSPDGRYLAILSGTAGGLNRLWIRALDQLTPQLLEGTEDASFPFWSPDSRSVAFFAGHKLKWVPISGGRARTVCDAESGRGGSWNADGVIVFAKQSFSALFRVPASGGLPRETTRLNVSRGEVGHRWPCFLPDNRHFLYFSFLSLKTPGSDTNGGIFVGSLEGSDPDLVVETGSNCQFLPPDRLLFARGDDLLAQRFDMRTLKTTGDPISIEQGIAYHTEKHFAHFSASTNDVLAYAPAREAQLSELRWLDRTGADLGALGEPGVIGGFRLSPDNSQVAISLGDARPQRASIWLHDVARGFNARVTADPAAFDNWPAWSPRGDALVFSSIRGHSANVYRLELDGASTEKEIHLAEVGEYVCDWSPDDRWIACLRFNPVTDSGTIWFLGTGGEERSLPFFDSRFEHDSPQFSPDGKWIAYVSNDSGRREVYVAPFPGPGQKRRISNHGGEQPRWRKDGKELFFISADDRLMAVEVSPEAPSRTGEPGPLFALVPNRHGDFPSDYDVSNDGQRFLVRKTVSGHRRMSPMVVVLNWSSEFLK